MFSSIKIKLLKRGKIQKVRLLALLQDFEDRISALEGVEPFEDSISGLEDVGSIPKPTGVVTISLKDCISQLPLSGAKITINGETRTTGSAGGCTFNLTYDISYNVEGEYNGEDFGLFTQIHPTEEEHEYDLCVRIE